MPCRPPSPCTQPGCPNKATNRGRCPDHQRPAWVTTTSSSTERGYGARWQRLRHHQLSTYPVCQIRTHCDGALATEVDHIKPKAQGGTDEPTNLRSACKACHKAKTQQDALSGRPRAEPSQRT
jgi:5-methylcytosine-specific restriction protein A